MDDFKHTLVKQPAGTQAALCLIREELKSRKLFLALREAGIDDCFFQPHLDFIILHNLGLNEGSDATQTRCAAILDKRSRLIEANHDSIIKQAQKAYADLLALKKEMSRNTPT